nr:MAG TPA: hypothetical protein [Caudoviricetes sp.]
MPKGMPNPFFNIYERDSETACFSCLNGDLNRFLNT